ncbi:Decarboxylase tropJ [Exophiala dermatitidis]
MESDKSALTSALRDLISANHILHHHGVVDAYGHVSIRHPSDPSLYIMCGFLAPALVSSPSDLIHYRISDSSAVDPNAGRGYSERFIHGELYKRFSDVHCVIHSHAEEVLPYVVTGVKLRAVYHMAGFLNNKGVKVFDIDPLYRDGEQRDMLVLNERFGAALAEEFAGPDNTGTETVGTTAPVESVVLMRRQGYTVVGRDIITAVYRAIYTRINAEAQTKAMAIANHAVNGPHAEQLSFSFQGLTDEQSKGCAVMNEGYQAKPWRLWVREVERLPLYENTLARTKTLPESTLG